MRAAITFEGKRYWVSGKDPDELSAKKALKLKELEEGKIIESNMLVKAWSKEWLENYKLGSCGDKTYRDYEHRLDMYILPEIGHMRLKDVKPIHLQKIMRSVSHMSQSRIDKIHQCLGQMFRTAEANDLISKDPTRGLVKPKGTAGSHRAITDYERQVILKLIETHKHGLWIEIMLSCGLRTGETARIKVMHFDFEKKTLFVDGTKNKYSKRYVPITDSIIEKVKATGKDPFEYLFTNVSNNPISESNRHYMWNSFKTAMHAEMGGQLHHGTIVEPCLVAPDLVPYCLRHTFCTDCQDAGVPINIAKELMGHSDIALTARIYTHFTENSMQTATLLLEKHRNFNENCNTNCNTKQVKMD